MIRLRTRLAQMIRALLLRSDAGEPPGHRLHAPCALAWLTAVPVTGEDVIALSWPARHVLSTRGAPVNHMTDGTVDLRTEPSTFDGPFINVV